MKRCFNVFLLIVITFSLVGCSSNEPRGKVHSNDYLALVTNTAGINDNSFNQLAWQGLQKAAKELDFDVEYLESVNEEDFMPNLRYFTACALDMLICIGPEMADKVREIAEIYPDEYYLMMNYTFDEPLKNVLCVEFEDQEAAFMEGFLAAYLTKTGIIGLIGGMECGIIDAFKYGFEAGMHYAAAELNKQVSLCVEYINSFSNKQIAKEVADKMYEEKGADIIFHVAGGAGDGVIESAKEHDKFVIGSDMDQNKMAPKNVISSAIRNIDKVVYDIAKEIKEVDDVKRITGKSRLLGLKENAVGIAPSTKNMVPKELMDKLEKIESDIKNEVIDVPYSEQTFEAYMKKIDRKN